MNTLASPPRRVRTVVIIDSVPVDYLMTVMCECRLRTSGALFEGVVDEASAARDGEGNTKTDERLQSVDGYIAWEGLGHEVSSVQIDFAIMLRKTSCEVKAGSSKQGTVVLVLLV